MKKYLFPSIGMLAAFNYANAELTLPNVFGDHMILQADKPATIWGKSDAGSKITVAFGDQKTNAQADAKGKWKVSLKPMPASAEAGTLTVSDGTDTKTYNDVLVGEVWFASGQSNMQWSIRQSADPQETAAAADFPGIRFFMAKPTAAPTPQDNVEGKWLICSPQNAPQFSAVAYHFAAKLHSELNVPVGIVQSAWGGKPVETFTSAEALASIPEGKGKVEAHLKAVASFDENKAKADHEKALKKYEEAMAEWKSKPKDKQGKAPRKPRMAQNPGYVAGRPTTLWNGMIYPLVPYSIRGAIWYQGESNAQTVQSSTDYGKLFPLMIEDWRKQWGDDFRYLWVQLANFKKAVEEPGTNEPWAVLQEQQRLSLSLDKTGMAIINDIGTPNNIHPPNKKDVGERLARWALADDYGKDVVKSGPLYKSHKIDGDVILVEFDHAGGGLKTSDGESPKRFEIKDSEGKWHWAEAKISGSTIMVSSKGLQKPTAARYAWASNPEGANLVNSEGLPGSIFTTE